MTIGGPVLMNKKLITIDLDGTTLGNNSELTEKTKQTLRNADRAGHIVSIATGRPYRLSKGIYQELGIKNPMINFNGALCHFPEQEKWEQEYRLTVSKDIAFEAMKLKKEINIEMVCAEGRDSVLSDKMMEHPFFFPVKKDVASLTSNSLKEDPTSICIFAEPDELILIRDELSKRCGKTFDARTWGGAVACLELVQPGVQKALGVQKLAAFYEIDQQDIISLGDEDNDMEMIEYAGVGVAMQNAIPELKKVANLVTEKPNYEDGLAHFLDEYLALA